MMIQKQIDFSARAFYRKSDPETSREAAFAGVASGTFGRTERLALRYVAANPGRTAKELEVIAGVEAGTIRKRLAGLKRKGKLINGDSRKCNVSGRNARTWKVVLTPVA
jgi:predicted HTH transcriptional regulator